MHKHRAYIVSLLRPSAFAAAILAGAWASIGSPVKVPVTSHSVSYGCPVERAAGSADILVDPAAKQLAAQGGPRRQKPENRFIECTKKCLTYQEAISIIARCTPDPDFGGCVLQDVAGRAKDCVLKCLG
jgi:hypothetical protein